MAKAAQRQGKNRGNDHASVRYEDREQPTRLESLDPVSFMRRFMEDVGRVFDGFGPGAMWMPPVEMLEKEDQIVIRADVPGLGKDQIAVEFQDGQLVISGERRQELNGTRDGFYRSERVYGRFYRVIPLPEAVDSDRATATVANGVLEVTMPAPPHPTAKRVEVQEIPGTRQAQNAA